MTDWTRGGGVMGLNCKLGDLAIVVNSVAGNEGKIVRCVKFLGLVEFVDPDGSLTEMAAWEVDPPLPGWDGVLDTDCPDEDLRPIKPLDELDDVTRDNEVTA